MDNVASRMLKNTLDISWRTSWLGLVRFLGLVALNSAFPRQVAIAYNEDLTNRLNSYLLFINHGYIRVFLICFCVLQVASALLMIKGIQKRKSHLLWPYVVYVWMELIVDYLFGFMLSSLTILALYPRLSHNSSISNVVSFFLFSIVIFVSVSKAINYRFNATRQCVFGTRKILEAYQEIPPHVLKFSDLFEQERCDHPL